MLMSIRQELVLGTEKYSNVIFVDYANIYLIGSVINKKAHVYVTNEHIIR